jgi:hypothetical protein
MKWGEYKYMARTGKVRERGNIWVRKPEGKMQIWRPRHK